MAPGLAKQSKQVWAESKCGVCRSNPSDIICERCAEEVCASCIEIHRQVHARDKYIEAIALGRIKHGVPQDELSEAMALQLKWKQEQQ